MLASLFRPERLRRELRAARRRPVRRVEHRVVGLETLESRIALAITVDVFDNTNLGTAGSVYITGHGIPGAQGAPETDLRVLAPSGSFVQAAVQIHSATCTGTTARITTKAAHQLRVHDQVGVDGVGVPGYNGVFTVTNVQPGANPTWFEYTVPSQLHSSQGGAAYLPTLLSTQAIKAATIDAGGNVTVTLSGAANLPKATPIFVAGLSGGSGVAWNGMFTVTQNPQTNPALTTNQFQYTTSVPAATATATVTAGSQVTIVALTPVSVASLPKNPATQRPSVTLDGTIETYSSQLVPMVTPAGQSPFPLGLTSGTINIANYNPAPFSVGEQIGNSVIDIVEFFFDSSATNSTFDLSQVDGFALPLTISTSPTSVTKGPFQVGLNTTLANLSREQIGNAFKSFIGYEPVDVQETGGNFGRLLYDSGLSANPLTVAQASQTGTALTGVGLQPGKAPSSATSFTGSITGTTLNVSTNADKLAVNKIIEGTGVSQNTYITKINQINQDGSGTFTVNQSQTVASTLMTGYNATGVITATKAANGLVPGQSITVSAPGSAYDGQNYTVTLTSLNDHSLSTSQFQFQVPTAAPPDAVASARVTPTNSGVIASGIGNLVVTVTSGTLPAAGSTVQLSDVPNGTFSASVNGPYTVQNPPTGASLPANAVYLATTTGQTFKVGNSTGGGTLSTPVFAAPPAVPGNQFFVIAAPKDWLANQPVAVANVDPMVGWWDDTIEKFFSTGNYLQVAVGGSSYTGVFNDTGYDFYSGLATSGHKAFTIAPPTPQSVFPTTYTTQSQSLANATWVWGQAVPADLAKSDQALVQDQIWGAMCRGVVLDGVLKSPPTSTGQSNTLWTDPSKWYTERTNPAFPGFTSVYCPFSKFLHYSTLKGETDRTGTTSIYLGNLAYGFSEDETPYGANGQAIATATPSKMDGTVADGATMTLTVNPWNGGTPQAPYVSSIDTIPPQSPPGTPTQTTATTLSWTVTFSERVKGVTLDDFVPNIVSSALGLDIKGVTANSGTALSQTWTVTGDVTGTGTGVIGVNLTKAGSITDASGTPLTLSAAFPGQTYRVTTNPVGPTATLAIAGTNPTDAASVPFTVTFSQAVTGLTPANFTTVTTGGVVGTSVQSVQVVPGSGNAQYTVTVNTGTGSGTLALQLASAAGLSPAPRDLPVTSAAYTINKNDPTKGPELQGIALAGPSPTGAASVSWTVTFTEPVTGVTAANFTVAASGLGGTPAITGVTPASGTNTATWTVTATTGSGSGTLGLDMVNSTNVRDADSQAVTNVPFTGAAYTVDRTAPAAQSIVRANASPTSLSLVSWTVSFSEAVAGVNVNNFNLVSSGLSGTRITQVVQATSTGTAWTVTALTGSGTGTLGLDMVNATGITDAVGLSPTGIPLAGQSYDVVRGDVPGVRVPIAFWAEPGRRTNLVWPRGLVPFTGPANRELTVTLAATGGDGSFAAVRNIRGVTVAGTGTGPEISLTGTARSLNAYFRTAGRIGYTPSGESLLPRVLAVSAVTTSDTLAGFDTAAILVRGRTSPGRPTIASQIRLGPTPADTPLEISYDTLLAAANVPAATTRSVEFLLGRVSTGRLEIWDGAEWRVVVPRPPRFASRFEQPLLAPGGRIKWTPRMGQSGEAPAFTVRVWDGRLKSANVSQVFVDVPPVG